MGREAGGRVSGEGGGREGKWGGRRAGGIGGEGGGREGKCVGERVWESKRV